MTVAMPELDSREEVRDETATGPGQVAHIVLKTEALEGYINGVMLEALCGYKWVPSKDPKDKPVCLECKAVFDDDEAIILANPRVRGELGL